MDGDAGYPGGDDAAIEAAAEVTWLDRRAMPSSRNPSRAPTTSLRDRLRRLLTEPVTTRTRHLSEAGTHAGRSQDVHALQRSTISRCPAAMSNPLSGSQPS